MKAGVLSFGMVVGMAGICGWGQAAAGPEEKGVSTRYAVAAIDDATFYGGMRKGSPQVLNQILVEPAFDMHYRERFSLSTSLIGINTTERDNTTTGRVKETYAGVSMGDFDLTVGRKLVRWGTGYAFTAVGVLDPPRDPANPTDRLNTNEGRDMVKADWVRGRHALTGAWLTKALARGGSTQTETAAFRYNVLVHGFDTAAIAGVDRGKDTFGGLTATRVLGQAWEVHGETLWRDGEAGLVGGKMTMRSGVTFIGEFYTAPERKGQLGLAGPGSGERKYSAFVYAGKSRLRELPGWKEWDVSGSVAIDVKDASWIGVADASRWFGTHFSSYVHLEVPHGERTSTYGAVPYASSTSVGIRFHL